MLRFDGRPIRVDFSKDDRDRGSAPRPGPVGGQVNGHHGYPPFNSSNAATQGGYRAEHYGAAHGNGPAYVSQQRNQPPQWGGQGGGYNAQGQDGDRYGQPDTYRPWMPPQDR